MWTSRRRSATPPQTPSSARRARACAHHSAPRSPRPRRIGALARPQRTRHAHALLARVHASAASRLSDLPASMAHALRRAARSAVRVDARERSRAAPTIVLHPRRTTPGPATASPAAHPGRLLTAGRVGLRTANRTFAECSPEHPGTFAGTCCARCANSCVTACAERCDPATRGWAETAGDLVGQGLEPLPTLFLSPRSGTNLTSSPYRLCAHGTGTSYRLLRCCLGSTVGVAPVLVGVGWLRGGCMPAGSAACGVSVRLGASSSVLAVGRRRPASRRVARLRVPSSRQPRAGLAVTPSRGARPPSCALRARPSRPTPWCRRATAAGAPRVARAVPATAPLLAATPGRQAGVRLPVVGWPDLIHHVVAVADGLLPWLLATVAVAALVVVATRLVGAWRTRRGLAQRVRLVPVPTTSFDASPAEVDATAQVWARAADRTVGGWATKRAGAARVLLGQDARTGKMVYALEVPEWAEPTMALPPYGEVQLRPAEEFQLRGDPRRFAPTLPWWWSAWR